MPDAATRQRDLGAIREELARTRLALEQIYGGQLEEPRTLLGC